MAQFDVRTAIFLTALSATIMGVAMLIASRSHADSVRGMQRWAWSCGGQGIGWALLFARDSVPASLSIVLANTVLMGCVALCYQALNEFYHRPVQRTTPALIVGAAAGALLVFTYTTPSVVARTLVVSFTSGVLMLLCAHAILHRRTRSLMFSQWMTGGAFLVWGLAALVRVGLVATVVPAESLLFATGPLQSLVHGFVFINVIVVSFGFLLMCNDHVHAELRALATHDALTGALNRGAIERRLRDECRASVRTQAPLSVLLLDIDHFKQINDTYGHGMGDFVLQHFVAIVQSNLRCDDVVGRYGGEEFMVVLRETRLEYAHKVAERLRLKIEQAAFEQGEQRLFCTVSIGVAVLSANEFDPQALVQRADEALYQAKRRGRNRIMLADLVPPPVLSSMPV